jgi:hypothetical protein
MANFLAGAKAAVLGPDKKEQERQEQERQRQQQQQQHQQHQQHQHQQAQQRPGAPFGAAMGHQAPNPTWSTRLGQCDPPATCEQWACACLCHQCASAKAKSQTDGTDPCYNFFCWHWIGGMSFVRREYGIKGACGDDLMCGLFCFPCLVRRGLTESELRGAMPNALGAVNARGDREWATTLFACDCCEFFEALICPFCVAHYTRNMVQPGERGDCCFDMMCVIPFAMYGQARHRYGVQAEFGVLEDLCLPLVCYPCALAQARREAAHWMRSGGGNHQQVHNGRGGCCCC